MVLAYVLVQASLLVLASLLALLLVLQLTAIQPLAALLIPLLQLVAVQFSHWLPLCWCCWCGWLQFSHWLLLCWCRRRIHLGDHSVTHSSCQCARLQRWPL